MRREKRSAVCAILVAGFLVGQATAAVASDFLWKVSGKTGVVYLVGSVHLLTQDFYPLSMTLEGAFTESDLLVEEVDMAQLTSPQTQMQILSRGMLPSNQTLDTVLSPTAFARISRRVEQLGMPIEPLKRFKPWLLALTLAQVEWQKAGFDAELGLDKHFYDRARKEGKPLRGLETAELQISLFDGLSADQQERLLNDTLRGLDTEMANVRKLAQAWKTGDIATIEQIILQDLKDDPPIYERLLAERNRKWLPQIEPLLGRSGRAFVVVGAAHLVGPDGLIAMLKAKGYRVEQM